uniref:Phage tail protein n=1 Tax=Heterorhabditis bacteriophora TaxID=37862 RepID=A0A1I7WIZ7_HETBA
MPIYKWKFFDDQPSTSSSSMRKSIMGQRGFSKVRAALENMQETEAVKLIDGRFIY